MKQKTYRLLTWLGPDLTALILFTLLWFAMVLVYGGKIHLVEGSILLPMYIVILFLFIALFAHIRAKMRGHATHVHESFLKRARRILRDWLPVIYLVMVYETLRDYTGLIRTDYIDDILHKWDVAIFGVEPVLWIQKFIHPFWTDYFTAMYAIYIVPVFFIAGMLYYAKRMDDFRETALAVVLCLYIGFFGYIIFPAGPPRFHPELPFDPEILTGLFGFYDFTNDQMNKSLYVIHRASFPSLHVALSTLAMFQAWRFRDLWSGYWLFIVTSWIGIGVWVATVYLRHHWTVDIFAGWVLAAIAYFGAKYVFRGFQRMRKVAEKNS